MAVTTDNWPYLAFVMHQIPNGASYNPPIVFPDFNPGTTWAVTFWVHLKNNIGNSVFGVGGTEGEFFRISHEGTSWIWYVGKGEEIIGDIKPIVGIQVGKWMAMCITKQGNLYQAWAGFEDVNAPAGTPVSVGLAASTTFDIEFKFDALVYLTSQDNGLCNFKFWNAVIDPAQMGPELNNWRHEPAYGPAPMWATPLRTPGDTYNHAHLDTSANWLANHAWTAQAPEPWTRLRYFPDPIYLAHNTKASSWIAPTDGLENAEIFLNPGVAPLATVTYEAPQFHTFFDRATIPPNSSLFSITYFGHFYNTGGRQDASDAWGLYIDENGVKYNLTNDNSYKFDANGAAKIYGPITIPTMYLWQFGAMFTWQLDPTQNLTSTAHVNQIMLFVEYFGQFEVTPLAVNGIFTLARGGRSLDDYGVGKQMKIPNPTIRTALIGE